MASNSNNAAAGGAGAVYGLGFLGALVWNWQQAETFWGYPWGVIESFFLARVPRLPAVPGGSSGG